MKPRAGIGVILALFGSGCGSPAGKTVQAAVSTSDYVFELIAKRGSVIGGKKVLQMVSDGNIAIVPRPFPISINDSGDIAFAACTAPPPEVEEQNKKNIAIGASPALCQSWMVTFTSKGQAFPGGPNRNLFISNSGTVAYYGTIDGEPVKLDAPSDGLFNNSLDYGVIDAGGGRSIYGRDGKLKKSYPGNVCDQWETIFNDRGDIGCWHDTRNSNASDLELEKTSVDILLNDTVIAKGLLPRMAMIRNNLSSNTHRLSLNSAGQIAFIAAGGIGFAGPNIPEGKVLKASGPFILNDQGAILAASGPQHDNYQVSFLPDFTRRLNVEPQGEWLPGISGGALLWAFNNRNQVAVLVQQRDWGANGGWVYTEYLLRGSPKK